MWRRLVRNVHADILLRGIAGDTRGRCFADEAGGGGARTGSNDARATCTSCRSDDASSGGSSDAPATAASGSDMVDAGSGGSGDAPGSRASCRSNTDDPASGGSGEDSDVLVIGGSRCCDADRVTAGVTEAAAVAMRLAASPADITPRNLTALPVAGWGTEPPPLCRRR